MYFLWFPLSIKKHNHRHRRQQLVFRSGSHIASLFGLIFCVFFVASRSIGVGEFVRTEEPAPRRRLKLKEHAKKKNAKGIVPMSVCSHRTF